MQCENSLPLAKKLKIDYDIPCNCLRLPEAQTDRR